MSATSNIGNDEVCIDICDNVEVNGSSDGFSINLNNYSSADISSISDNDNFSIICYNDNFDNGDVACNDSLGDSSGIVSGEYAVSESQMEGLHEVEDLRKNHLLFYCQAFVIIAIVIACIVNLSLCNGDQTAWTGLLSTSLGILLPQPVLNIKRRL
jgi:hypothetical protein